MLHPPHSRRSSGCVQPNLAKSPRLFLEGGVLGRPDAPVRRQEGCAGVRGREHRRQLLHRISLVRSNIYLCAVIYSLGAFLGAERTWLVWTGRKLRLLRLRRMRDVVMIATRLGQALTKNHRQESLVPSGLQPRQATALCQRLSKARELVPTSGSIQARFQPRYSRCVPRSAPARW